MKNQSQKQKGFFLIEVVVASSIISVVLIMLLGLIQNSVEVSQRSLERTQAGYLLEEGSEAVKVVRDNAWTNITSLSTSTTYYLSWGVGTWDISTTPNSVGQFTRTVVVNDVSRDGSDDIVITGGTNDAGTKKFTINVSWTTSAGETKSENMEFYISDIRS